MSFPERKHPRLKEYDYSSDGYYFVTLCTQDNKPILSTVGRVEIFPHDKYFSAQTTETCNRTKDLSLSGLAPAKTPALTRLGLIAQQQLFALERRYPFVEIDKFVIMPTHIHTIIIFRPQSAGASPRPTLPDIVCAYKSITTRLCNQSAGTAGRKLFQTSFYEKVIRNEESYQKVWQYIDENPDRWLSERNAPAQGYREP